MSAPRFGERRYRTRLKYRTGWPELTALVDILFLSLLFFALNGNVTWVSGIKVDLPKVNTRTRVKLERFVITLAPPAKGSDAKMSIHFRDEPCDIDELRKQLSKLQESSSNASVIIRVDRSIPFSEVANVLDAVATEKLHCFFPVDAKETASNDYQEK